MTEQVQDVSSSVADLDKQSQAASKKTKKRGRNHYIPTTREFAFSAMIRIFHWLRLITILCLVPTGFYLAWPFLMPPKSTDILVQGWIRFGHLVFGFIFAAITINRCYFFLFSRDKSERRSLKDALNCDRWKAQIRAYIFLGKPDEKAGLYGPMQLVTYATFYSCSLVMVITGFVLYANVYHQGFGGLIYPIAEWITTLVGGLVNIRIIHHWFTWVFIIFLFVHIYLAIWTGLRFKKAAVDAIISGYDYHDEEEDEFLEHVEYMEEKIAEDKADEQAQKQAKTQAATKQATTKEDKK